MAELTLLIRSQFSLRLNCHETLWLYVDKSRLQSIPQSFYGNCPKNSIYSNRIWFVWFASVWVKNWNHEPRSKFQAIPHFRRDYLRSTSGIICCSGAFSTQFGDHLRSGIICGAVQYKRQWKPSCPIETWLIIAVIQTTSNLLRNPSKNPVTALLAARAGYDSFAFMILKS